VGRDGLIILLMDHLSQIIESNRLDKEMAKQTMEAVTINISENRSVTLYDVFQNYLWFSPHPKDSLEARWGLEKCQMIFAQTRATENSIAFIEKTYRKRDPEYADFSVRQQQQILGKLREEWSRSDCRETPPAPRKESRPSPHQVVPIEARRGLKRCGRIHAEIGATRDSIAFIEKTYRERDPDYADFSIRQQQQDLRRLREEWSRSECGEP
jgi:hypothetical protein